MRELTSNESLAAVILDVGVAAIEKMDYCIAGLAYVGLQSAADTDRDLVETAHQLIGRLSESSASLSTFLINYFDILEQGIEKNPEVLLQELKESKEKGEMMHSMIILDPISRAEAAQKKSAEIMEEIKERLSKALQDKGDQSE